MSVTKQEIVRSAAKLFSERGFPSTSIQDIADDCQIAKGSVYKYFPSKEDLFIEVFDQCQNAFFEQAEQIKLVPGRSPRERFLQQIIMRLQYFIEYKFVLVEFKEHPIQQNAKFIPLRLRARGRFLNWHKECLLNVYGPEIEPNIWDLVIIHKSILKEYLFWIIHEDKPVSVEETAQFVAETLDILAKHMTSTQPKPLLTEPSIAQYVNWGLEGRKEEKEQVIEELIENIGILINEIPSGNSSRQELQEILNLVREEISKKEPKGPLIQALLAYLEKEKELKSLVIQLKNVIMHWK